MTVYLVGAGPGEPGLVTVRGAALLADAGAVVHDRLVDARLLELAPPGALRVDVGKRPGGPVRQDEINELLVRLGREHEAVVRLKGGDPYLFGRGGEEALALLEAGVEFEVVPGISSVHAVPSYGGIPLTHRGLAAGYVVVTGHSAGPEGAAEPAAVDWEALGALDLTVVVVMGVAHRAEIATRLQAGGRPPSTPVAVISHGTLPAQQVVRTTLDRLAEAAAEPPAVLVVGAVAGLDLDWWSRRPLAGWTVAVTRARAQAGRLSALLTAAGAAVVEVPAIEIGPPSDGGAALGSAARRIGSYDWVALASANAVDALFAHLRDARDLGGVRVAAVGAQTADALAGRGVVADLVPPVAVAEELASAFGPAASRGVRVLVPQAAGARPALVDGLAALGYEVEAVEAYSTLHPPLEPTALAGLASADAVTFTSASTVEGILAAAGRDHLPPVVCSIGPVTSAAARRHGLEVAVEAPEASVAALVDALAGYAAAHPRRR